MTLDEKKTPRVDNLEPTSRSPSLEKGTIADFADEREVFKKGVNGVDFRTVYVKPMGGRVL